MDLQGYTVYHLTYNHIINVLKATHVKYTLLFRKLKNWKFISGALSAPFTEVIQVIFSASIGGISFPEPHKLTLH